MTTPRMPDPPATGRSSPESPIDAAQVLEDAADLLLIHGRCKGQAHDGNGMACVLGAMTDVSSIFGTNRRLAERALDAHLIASGVTVDFTRLLAPGAQWNDATDDDFEVIDTLRLVAKDLRNTAVPS